MGEAKRRRNIKPQGSCIFCGKINALTREHVFPLWMHSHLPKGADVYRREATRSLTNMPLSTPMCVSAPLRGGPQITTASVVCAHCNNTWMSSLEQQARPLLIPLVQGKAYFFNARNLKELASWIALKVIVLQHHEPPAIIYDEDERKSFFDSKIPSERMNIWLARHNSRSWECAYTSHSSGVFMKEKEGEQEDFNSPNIQTLTLGMGKLAIFVISVPDPSRAEKFDLRSYFGEAFCPLSWQKDSTLLWPPKNFLTDDGIQQGAWAVRNFLRHRFGEDHIPG